jgi:hypothetical protein
VIGVISLVQLFPFVWFFFFISFGFFPFLFGRLIFFFLLFSPFFSSVSPVTFFLVLSRFFPCYFFDNLYIQRSRYETRLRVTGEVGAADGQGSWRFNYAVWFFLGQTLILILFLRP